MLHIMNRQENSKWFTARSLSLTREPGEKNGILIENHLPLV